MATSQSDFDNLVETGTAVFLAGGSNPQWEKVVRILQEMAALWKMKATTGTIPNDLVLQVYFSNGTLTKAYRLGYSATGPSFRLDKNVGSDVSPSWTNLWAATTSSGLLTLLGGLTSGGVVTGTTFVQTTTGSSDFGGGDLTNIDNIAATTVNSITIGGSVAASDVSASAGVAGTNASFARTDHTHRGVSSISEDGGALAYGAINLVSGANVSVSRAGQDVTIAYAKPARSLTKKTTDQASITAETDITQLTALAFPATANGVKVFRVMAVVNVIGSAAATLVRLCLYVGTNGNKSDTTPVAVACTTTTTPYQSQIVLLYDSTPATSAKIGLSLLPGAANAQTVYGGNTITGLTSTLEIWELPT